MPPYKDMIYYFQSTTCSKIIILIIYKGTRLTIDPVAPDTGPVCHIRTILYNFKASCSAAYTYQKFCQSKSHEIRSKLILLIELDWKRQTIDFTIKLSTRVILNKLN